MLVHDRERLRLLLGQIASEITSHELYRIEESSTEFQLKRTNYRFRFDIPDLYPSVPDSGDDGAAVASLIGPPKLVCESLNRDTFFLRLSQLDYRWILAYHPTTITVQRIQLPALLVSTGLDAACIGASIFDSVVSRLLTMPKRLS